MLISEEDDHRLAELSKQQDIVSRRRKELLSFKEVRSGVKGVELSQSTWDEILRLNELEGELSKEFDSIVRKYKEGK
jgi:hypothetical protein